MQSDVVVVGAGAAGILAAWHAATLGANTLLLEKTSRIGTKILISGGGKCNITHDGPIKDVLRDFRSNEAQFLRPACYRFPNIRIVEMLTQRGLEVYTRPDGCIFPVNRTAKDVVAILGSYLQDAGVTLRFHSPVTGLVEEHGRVSGVRCGETVYHAKAVVIATGGSSYPGSGTTGDGWPWAERLGHEIVKIRAALAPIHIVRDEAWAERSGIALRDCILKARQHQKEIARWAGDVLFTHHGISGPTALGISRIVAEHAGQGPIALEVDLCPHQSFEEIRESLQHWAEVHPRRLWPGFLEGFLPERLIPWFLDRAQVLGTQAAGTTDKKARNRLVTGLKGWTLGQVRDVPIEKGEVVAGGIALSEVDPHTLRSLKAEGLFLCGEVLDIAGPVGGYNLQAAFATGYVAGESAAKDALG